MSLAMSGAGMVTIEMTDVERRGRITHGCLGLYSDDNEAAAQRTLAAARRVAPRRHAIRHPARPCRPQGVEPDAVGRRRAAEARRRSVADGLGRRPSPSTPAGTCRRALERSDIAQLVETFRRRGKAGRARRLRLRRNPRRARLSDPRVPVAALQPARRIARAARWKTACVFCSRSRARCARRCRSA